MSEVPTGSYLIRIIYEWCTDNNFTPYITVFIDSSTGVPRELVKSDEIILNISFDTTNQLDMSNEWITFHTRFSGVSHKIEMPIENVPAVYACENGQNVAFPVERSIPTTRAATEYENNPPPKPAAVDSESASASVPAKAETDPEDKSTPPNVPRIGGKPTLKVAK